MSAQPENGQDGQKKNKNKNDNDNIQQRERESWLGLSEQVRKRKESNSSPEKISAQELLSISLANLGNEALRLAQSHVSPFADLLKKESVDVQVGR